MNHRSPRHGDMLDQVRIVSFAHSVDLSLWQPVQGFGILNCSVIVGVMKLNVWLLTFTFAMVCSIFGMWHATQSLPGLPFAW